MVDGSEMYTAGAFGEVVGRAVDQATKDLTDAAYIEWMRSELARFTYKPGWSFRLTGDVQSIYDTRAGIYTLIITMNVEDSRNPGRMIDVSSTSTITAYSRMDSTQFARILATNIRDLEIHESREWLRRDGEIWDDPHAARTMF